MSYHDKELEVIRWAEANGHITSVTPNDKAIDGIQTIKELCDAIAFGEPIEKISLAMGQVAIDMIVLCAMLDIDLAKCLEQAFEKISAKVHLPPGTVTGYIVPQLSPEAAEAALAQIKAAATSGNVLFLKKE